MARNATKRKRGNRTGFTTGACSAAAARAAVLGLARGKIPKEVECRLPNGQIVTFAIAESHLNSNSARAVVIKDAGDDPDCTDKARLTAEVRMLPPEAQGKVELKGGRGVGRVTLDGLGLAVGGPAINPVPRRNIEENVRLAAGSLLQRHGLQITISVPDGERMAKRTINARLGILSGISILGTTGIVKPWSTVAFRASVIQGIEVARAQGHDVVVLTTGGRTEKFVMRQLPDLAPVCFVQMGDFLRYALDTAAKEGIRHVIIGGMAGKLSKIAQGETITHAGRSRVDMKMLAHIAAGIGAPEKTCRDIETGPTARFAVECMDKLGLASRFQTQIARKVIDTLSKRYPGKFSITVMFADFSGNEVVRLTGGGR